MIQAGVANVRRMNIIQLAQIDVFAGKRVDQYRLLNEAHVRPGRAKAIFLFGPTGAIGTCREMVGTRLEVGFGDAKHSTQLLERTILMADAAALVVDVAHQHQRFFSRVMQPGGEFFLPEVCAHGSGQPGKVVVRVVEDMMDGLPHCEFGGHGCATQ